MVVLPDPFEFEWDSGNTDKSVVKHAISNKEAEEVFVHRPLLVFDDATHSLSEKRFQAFGKTDNKKLLFVAFTIRKTKIRIISVRLMDKKERRIYEQAKKVQEAAHI